MNFKIKVIPVKERVKQWDNLYRRDLKRYGEEPSIFIRIFSTFLKSFHQELNLSVADIGCGYGRNIIYLKKLFPHFDLTCIDSSPFAINLLKREIYKSNIGNINLLNLNILELENDNFNNRYDMIYSHFFLHLFYKHERTKIYNIIHSLLKPNGYFAMSVISINDSKFNRGERLEDNTFACYYNRPWHFIHFYSEREILEISKFFKIIHMFEYLEEEKIYEKGNFMIDITKAWFVIFKKEENHE